MTADEIAETGRRYRERLEALLTPEQLAHFDAYQRRVAEAVAAHDTSPVLIRPEEQAIFALIDADSQAQGLRAQLDILTRVGVSRQ